MGNKNHVCPDSCCTGDEILCIGIPCPIDIVVLGIDLQLEIPCVRLTSTGDLTDMNVQQLTGVLTGILEGNGNFGGGAA